MSHKVFLAVPCYGQLHPNALAGLLCASNNPEVRWGVKPRGSSLLAMSFNELICMAMNTRKEFGWTHFCMHHSDIETLPGFLDILLTEYDKYKPALLSTVLPIKDKRGLTSTGIRSLKNGGIVRMTMNHLWGEHQVPDTFGIDNIAAEEGDYLIVNTGLMIFNINQPWVEEWLLDEAFTIKDKVHKTPEGLFYPEVLPEDWGLSTWLHNHGEKVMATKLVTAMHHGGMGYPNNEKWGNWDEDQGDPLRT